MSSCPDCPNLSGVTSKREVCCCDVVPKVYAQRAPERRAEDEDSMLLRIPGRLASLGEITHKPVSQMNRKERAAFQSKKMRP